MANLTREEAWNVVRGGADFRADAGDKPRFKAGDAVRALNNHPQGHTRLPRYIRGKLGVVEQLHGGFVFADTRAHGMGDQPQHLYSVRFPATELWGPEASPNDSVSLTLWESYIEPLSASGGAE